MANYVFSSAWFYFCWNAQKKRKKANQEKLNAGRQFFKDVMCIFLMLLCVTLLHEGKIPFLRKNHHLYPQFPFINPPLRLKWRFSFIPPTPLYYGRDHLFNQLHLSWKNKLKHAGVDITRFFFQDAKSSLTKHKTSLLEASYGTSRTSRSKLSTKKLTSYSQKWFSQKSSALDVWNGPK